MIMEPYDYNMIGDYFVNTKQKEKELGALWIAGPRSLPSVANEEDRSEFKQYS